jgi:hypothetical protein
VGRRNWQGGAGGVGEGKDKGGGWHGAVWHEGGMIVIQCRHTVSRKRERVCRWVGPAREIQTKFKIKFLFELHLIQKGHS